jgi:hypothetical protein
LKIRPAQDSDALGSDQRDGADISGTMKGPGILLPARSFLGTGIRSLVLFMHVEANLFSVVLDGSLVASNAESRLDQARCSHGRVSSDSFSHNMARTSIRIAVACDDS